MVDTTTEKEKVSNITQTNKMPFFQTVSAAVEDRNQFAVQYNEHFSIGERLRDNNKRAMQFDKIKQLNTSKPLNDIIYPSKGSHEFPDRKSAHCKVTENSYIHSNHALSANSSSIAEELSNKRKYKSTNTQNYPTRSSDRFHYSHKTLKHQSDQRNVTENSSR